MQRNRGRPAGDVSGRRSNTKLRIAERLAIVGYRESGGHGELFLLG